MYTPEQEQTCRAEQEGGSGRGRYVSQQRQEHHWQEYTYIMCLHTTQMYMCYNDIHVLKCTVRHNWLAHVHTMSNTDTRDHKGHSLGYYYTHTLYVRTYIRTNLPTLCTVHTCKTTAAGHSCHVRMYTHRERTFEGHPAAYRHIRM